MSKEILLYPIVTEKSMSMTEEGRYNFIVVKTPPSWRSRTP